MIPLRERKDDIPLLAKHFVELSVKDSKCAKPRLTRARVVKLQSYDWPGNVRELRNVIESAVILARGGGLEFDLPLQTGATASPVLKSRSETAAVEADEQHFLTEAELQLGERDNLLRVLNKANWKVKGPDGAAELLGVNAALAEVLAATGKEIVWKSERNFAFRCVLRLPCRQTGSLRLRWPVTDLGR